MLRSPLCLGRNDDVPSDGKRVYINLITYARDGKAKATKQNTYNAPWLSGTVEAERLPPSFSRSLFKEASTNSTSLKGDVFHLCVYGEKWIK